MCDTILSCYYHIWHWKWLGVCADEIVSEEKRVSRGASNREEESEKNKQNVSKQINEQI